MMDNFKETFKVEAFELLAELEAALLELEMSPGDTATIGRTFRALHTIKGSGAMVGWDEIAVFTHEVENVFELVRQGRVEVSKELIDLTLAAGDLIRCMLESRDLEEVDQRGQAIIRGLKELVGSGESQGVACGESPNRENSKLFHCFSRIRYLPDHLSSSCRHTCSGNESGSASQ